MTGPQANTEGAETTRPISVAELLAKNGTIGAPPVTGRRRRRRGNTDAVTVAELTGEIPVVSDETQPRQADLPSPKAHSSRAPERLGNGSTPVAEPDAAPGPPPVDEPAPDQSGGDASVTPYWSQPEPRWPTSPPQLRRKSGPERSEYPRPVRIAGRAEGARAQADPRSGAEGMSPDPLEDYADMPVDVMDTDVREAEPASEDSAYVRSYLHDANELFGGPGDGTELADRVAQDAETADHAEVDEDLLDTKQLRAQDADEYVWSSRKEMLLHGGVVVLQSILAVAFGAGLFIAFDQLWQWNNIVALVLAVLVILGLVAAVQVVRKTVDTASTLIAVAVGALIAFGPLALLQSG